MAVLMMINGAGYQIQASASGPLTTNQPVPALAVGNDVRIVLSIRITRTKKQKVKLKNDKFITTGHAFLRAPDLRTGLGCAIDDGHRAAAKTDARPVFFGQTALFEAVGTSQIAWIT